MFYGKTLYFMEKFANYFVITGGGSESKQWWLLWLRLFIYLFLLWGLVLGWVLIVVEERERERE